MIKKTFNFTDFNGTEREVDVFFNLNRAEITKMEFSKKGGLSESLQAIIDAEDRNELLNVFEELILNSYGEKSADGMYFKKSPEARDSFKSSPIYEVLFMELINDANAMAAFVNGVTGFTPEDHKQPEPPKAVQ